MAPNILKRSLVNFKNITKGMFSLNEGLGRSQKYTANISKDLLKSSEKKKKYLRESSFSFKRKIESSRRKKSEGIIELSKVGAVFRAPGRVIADTTKGFFSRILNFAGTIMAGWMIYNLPSIIGMAQELGSRAIRLTQILQSFAPNALSILGSFGDVIGSYVTNFASFDFQDSSNRVENSMKNLNTALSGLQGSFDEVIQLFTTPLTKGLGGREDSPELGTDYSQRQGGGGGLPDPKSAEMYRIAAALSTEGSGPQSTVDMMQVVVNRKASGRYPGTYTDILAAPGPQFAGVWDRPGGPSGFRKIQTLQDAAKWSGQSEATLLGIIKNIQDPTLQANSAKFVGGALEFRAQPGYYRERGLVKGQMGPNGRFYGSAWRGGPGDNQFLKDPSRGDPVRPEGAASFNLPTPVSPTAKIQPSPRSTGTMNLVPQTGPGGFIQGGSSDKSETAYATHFHIDLKTPNYTQEGLLKIREVAFQAIKSMQARGSYVTFGNIPGYPVASKNDSILRSQILQEQQGHGSRSSPGVDVQEHNSKLQRTFPSQPGSKTTFPFAVGAVYWRGGYGREAEIIGSNGVTVSHGASGSRASELSQQPAPPPAPSAKISPTPRQPIEEKIVPESEQESYVVPFAYPQSQPQTQVVIPSKPQTNINMSDTSLNRFITKKLLLDLAYT